MRRKTGVLIKLLFFVLLFFVVLLFVFFYFVAVVYCWIFFFIREAFKLLRSTTSLFTVALKGQRPFSSQLVFVFPSSEVVVVMGKGRGGEESCSPVKLKGRQCLLTFQVTRASVLNNEHKKREAYNSSSSSSSSSLSSCVAAADTGVTLVAMITTDIRMT